MREGDVAPDRALIGVAARYLVGRLPSAHLLARCEVATRERLAPPAAGVDLALWRFVARHPWSLGPLDAAAAVLRPQGDLRSRLLVVAAVLEATPEYAEEFLPCRGGLLNLARLPVLGLTAVVRAFLGLMLWPLAGRCRR